MTAVRLLGDAAESDVVGSLFHTKRSGTAARLFLAWFRQKRGRATKSEVSGFANELASGSLGFRYGRTTFYRDVLRVFVDQGLIGLEPEMDRSSERVIKRYRRIIQPVQKRRPSSPSLIYNAHVLAEKWNRLFGE
jgi:hypothetical protein